MKITLIGGSNQGKTYFLTSLHKMATDIGRHGFHVQPKNFIDPDRYGPSNLWNSKNIMSSQEIREADLVLKKKEKPITEITVVDVIGQAVTGIKEGKVEKAKEILQHVVDSDAIAIIITAPYDSDTLSTAQSELSQANNFCSALFEKTTKKIPIALILTKIDSMPRAKDYGAKIDAIDKKLNDEFEGDFREYKKQILRERGKEVNKILTPIINGNLYLYKLIDKFYNIFRSDIPLRVFPSTNIGFGVEIRDGEVKIVSPYGTAAAMLWLIYAYFQSMDALTRSGFPSEEVLSDLMDLYFSGNAYFDENDSLWNPRNISDPFADPNL